MQLHKDSQEQQVLLDQQHEVIQQLEEQQQLLQVQQSYICPCCLRLSSHLRSSS